MALDMFLNLGATIKGETRDKAQAKTNDIEILSWSWGMSQSGSTHTGGGGGSGKASFQNISITKNVDSSSHALMVALAKGTHIAEAKLLVRKAGAGQNKYILITMKEVMITSLSTGGSGGDDRLTESVTLNFAEVKYEYTQQDGKGGMGGDKTFHWDIAKNAEGV